MRNTHLFVMTCALAVAAAPLMAKEAGSSAACWQPAFEKGDADAVAKCYAPDAVLWLPGSPAMKGRDAIRAGYADFFGASTIKTVKLNQLGKIAHGNESASWGTFSLVLVSKKDGKETAETGRYTDVSRRIGGHWQYVVDHASDDPAAPGG